MRNRFLGIAGVMFAFLLMGALPALANHIDSAVVTENCTSFTLTVSGGDIDQPTPAVNFEIRLTDPSGSYLVVSGTVPITPLPDRSFSVVLTKNWSDYGITLNGTECLSGTAMLSFNNGTSFEPSVPLTFTPTCITCPASCSGTIGDFVWSDTDCNGIQNQNENGLNGITVNLENAAGAIIATTTTVTGPNGQDGYYQFSGLCGGGYIVAVDASTLPAGFTPAPCLVGSDTAIDNNCSPSSTTLVGDNASNPTMDFGYCPGTATCTGNNCISLVKTANPVSTPANKPVTYTYVVTNTGGTTLTDVTIVDDNGTPNFPGDDFVVASGVTLVPGASQTFTVTTIPSTLECVSGSTAVVGTLSTQVLPNGDVKATYRQSLDLVDNSYGNTSSAGWGTKGHKFSDLTGSDKAQFAFTNGAGSTVLSFTIDYISASSAFPSGYGTLGYAGGDGSFTTGTKAWVLSYDTTFTDDLNKPQFRTGYTVNSPAAPNADWDYVDGYTVVVSHLAFGSSGFGGVSIPLVHNSPPKTGQGAVTPVACDADSTNTATATGSSSGIAVSATSSATVHIQGAVPPCANPDPKTGQCKPVKPPPPPPPPPKPKP